MDKISNPDTNNNDKIFASAATDSTQSEGISNFNDHDIKQSNKANFTLNPEVRRNLEAGRANLVNLRDKNLQEYRTAISYMRAEAENFIDAARRIVGRLHDVSKRINSITDDLESKKQSRIEIEKGQIKTKMFAFVRQWMREQQSTATEQPVEEKHSEEKQVSEEQHSATKQPAEEKHSEEEQVTEEQHSSTEQPVEEKHSEEEQVAENQLSEIYKQIKDEILDDIRSKFPENKKENLDVFDAVIVESLSEMEAKLSSELKHEEEILSSTKILEKSLSGIAQQIKANNAKSEDYQIAKEDLSEIKEKLLGIKNDLLSKISSGLAIQKLQEGKLEFEGFQSLPEGFTQIDEVFSPFSALEAVSKLNAVVDELSISLGEIEFALARCNTHMDPASPSNVESVSKMVNERLDLINDDITRRNSDIKQWIESASVPAID